MTRAPDWTSKSGDTADDDELRVLFARELPGLLTLARRLTRDSQDANDAVQDTFERAWRSREQLRTPTGISAWLRTILARRIIDLHRRQTAVAFGAPEDFDDLLPDVEDPAAVLAAAEDELLVRAALRQLSEPDRVALALHDGEGWSAAQVGEVLGTGLDATHKRIQRARVRFVTVLASASSPARSASGACREARAHANELLNDTLDEQTRVARASAPRHLPELSGDATSRRRRAPPPARTGCG